MNKRNLSLALIWIGVIITLAAVFKDRLMVPMIIEVEANKIAVSIWWDCGERDCDEMEVEIYKQNWEVVISSTYFWIKDDSIDAIRESAEVEYIEGQWRIKNELERTFKCQKDRWHQDFSSELCN